MSKKSYAVGIATVLSIVLSGCSALSPMEFRVWEFFEVEAQDNLSGVTIDNVPNGETLMHHYAGMSFAFSPDGKESYLSFVDHEESGDGDITTDSFPVRVIRYRDGMAEELPSPGMSRNGVTNMTGFYRGRYSKVIVDDAGVPYILYGEPGDLSDTGGPAAPTVKYLSGDAWVLHSTPMLGHDTAFKATSNTESMDLVFDPAGDMAFYQHRPGGQNDHPQLVRHYSGGTWSNYAVTANPADSGETAWDNPARSLEGRLAIDRDGKPYLFYIAADIFGIGVSRLNDTGDGWEYIGRDGSVSVTAADVGNYQWGSAVDSDGNLYVAYADSERNGRVTVTFFDGQGWSEPGGRGFSAGSASWVTIGISPDGIPHLLYVDASLGGRVVIQRYENGAWTSPALPGSRPGGVTRVGMGFLEDGRLIYGYYSADSRSIRIVRMKG